MFDTFRNDVLPKLLREWKTAAFLFADLFVETYDAAAGFSGLDPIIPERYRDAWRVAVPIIALGLRKWRDHVRTNDPERHPSTDVGNSNP